MSGQVDYDKLLAMRESLIHVDPTDKMDGKLVLKPDVIPSDKNLLEAVKPNRHQRRAWRASRPQRKQKHNVKTRMAAYCNVLTGDNHG